MLAAIDPGQQLSNAYFVLAIACTFTLGLPALLINGNQVSEEKLTPLTPEELAYEVEMFGWLAE